MIRREVVDVLLLCFLAALLARVYGLGQQLEHLEQQLHAYCSVR